MKKYNHLSQEKSPYLLQHKDNPVYWFAWGKEAFQAAKEENKVIFLSIGYSTCYWCHMMEKDSFETQEVADALNQDFISIKVDREEHPDIDQIYMDAVVGMTGQGGWPLTVFLTPDLKPFAGGTFFWRDQFLQVLNHLQESWQKNRDEIVQSGEKITDWLREKGTHSNPKDFDEARLQKAFTQLKSSFDPSYGGFGNAPKFPQCIDLSLLLKIYQKTNNEEALSMVKKSLNAMADGEIFDSVGGGFHRYATEANWSHPHYEKMLYDNALLVLTYLEAAEILKEKKFEKVAFQTLDYVLREMTDSEGGFYSAQDAGEVGKEGEFYRCKTQEERDKKTPPHKDDKILTSWNGLMIAAMSKGYQILDECCYLEAAQKSAQFIQKKLYQEGILLRRFREGEARFEGTLDDYAFLIFGLIHLYESDKDPHWIEWVKELQQKQDQIFWDEKEGGYFFSDPRNAELVIHKKEFHDGALPSGNAIVALNLLKLHELTFQQEYRSRAEELLKILSTESEKYPAGFASALIAMDYFFNRPKEVCESPRCKI